MRIIDYRDDYNSHYMNQWQKYHFIDELQSHGCDYCIFNRLQYDDTSEADEALISMLKQNHFDLFITRFNDKQIDGSLIKRIDEIGVPTLLVCDDNLATAYDYEKTCKDYSLVWLTCLGNEYMYKKWGADTIYLTAAANPQFLKYDINRSEVDAVGFVGNPHGSRIITINQLAKAVPITVHYGSANATDSSSVNHKMMAVSANQYANTIKDWIRYPVGRKLLAGAIKTKLMKNNYTLDGNICIKDSVPFEELDIYMSQYALSLSFSDAYSTGSLKSPFPVIYLRFFEIPMSGGVQFTKYTEEGASYFTEDKEIIFYHDYEEMIDKAKYYLSPNRTSIRNSIREAARLRAENEHTWWNRYTRIFERLNLMNCI